QEGWLCALAALAAPEVFLVGGGGAVPALVVLLIKGDLARGGVDEQRQVVRDERERLVEVDRRSDGAAHVGAQLELRGVAARLFVQASRLDSGRDLARGGSQGFDLAPVRPPFVRAVVADLPHSRGARMLVSPERPEDAGQAGVTA